MTIFITGGCGFIGSALIRWLLANTTVQIINLDALTYAAQPQSLDALKAERYTFVHGDIADQGLLDNLLRVHQPQAVVHLAAETHVDRSISGPSSFVQSNVVGTFTLLEAVRTWWATLEAAKQQQFRFLQVSTDEVYGDLGVSGAAACEQTRWRTSSPYSASKAAADHLADAWHRTYGLPVLVTHSSNNYGPWQYPEKLIPLLIRNALAGNSIPLYGSGEQVRDWMHVDDHARALWHLLRYGQPGEHYNIGADSPLTNREMISRVCVLLDQLSPKTAPLEGHASLVQQVADRLGHDWRYAVNVEKLHALGWQAETSLEQGLRETVAFYISLFQEEQNHSAARETLIHDA